MVCKTQLIVGRFDVLVTSYEACLREKGTLLKIHWDYLIIDEVRGGAAMM